MTRIAYVNGRYLPHRDARVHIDDRGYQFGDGIYEVVHVFGGRLVDEGLHLDRLDRSLREMRLASPCGRDALRAVMREVMRRNRLESGLLYMQVTRGVARREHFFPAAATPSALVVTMRRVPAYPVDVEAWTASAITLPDQRWARCDIKTTNLLPNVLARQAARDAGASEALFIDAGGNLTEGAATSVWVVDAGGRLLLRRQDEHILPGCTRAALLQLMADHDVSVVEAPCSLAALRGAREIFLTSATSFVKPVLKLDGAKVGDGVVGPVARRLFEIFARHVHGNQHNSLGASVR
jgi:D-alanine transaminase